MGELWVVVFYAIVFLVVVAVAGVLYGRAVASRKSYHCEVCGKRVRVELMDAKHCSQCGAPLKSKTHNDGS